MASLPLSAVMHIDIISLKNSGQRKKVSDIIIDHQYILTGKYIILHPDVLNNLAFFRRQCLVVDMQMRDRFFQQMFKGIHPFQENAAGVAC